MSFDELLSAVVSAFRGRDYARCFDLLDEFIESVAGPDFCQALVLKADLIMRTDATRIPEGLLLVEEALEHVQDDPISTLTAAVAALGLCFHLGDVERARRYELIGQRVLQQHPDDPGIQAKEFRLQINLGLVANRRGEFAAAYWHFSRALWAITTRGVDDESDVRCFLLNIYEELISVCLRMNRVPEAGEFLTKAKDCILSELDRVRWILARARFLRVKKQPQEAADLLAEFSQDTIQQWTPLLRARFHMVQAQIYQDLGQIRRFHRHLELAQREALTHGFDDLVCEIQRVQRTPISLEVMQ
ncbi:MAG TPA: hypothetical protein VD902_07445 [Symbiobacteriaceae bacterium]|nr:hypothetical protein [Symbiobacteriaceae bacterium]